MQQRQRKLSHEDLNEFFLCCHTHCSIIKNAVKDDSIALKSLVRMMAPLSISRENMIAVNPTIRLFVRFVLQALSEKLQTVWESLVESEWESFCEGLVTLFCIELYYTKPEKEMNATLDLLTMIPEESQRQKFASKLVNSLKELKCILTKGQEAFLYKLMGQKNLKLEQLDLASSLETYITYLTQILEFHQGYADQLRAKIETQLDRLLREKRFPSRKIT